MKTQETSRLPIIGATEFIEVADIVDIPAKIDTGADTSAIWASDIDMDKDGNLSFILFDKKSPFYTGKRMTTKEYRIKHIRSSYGDKQIRYRIKLPVTISGKTFETTFTLANRSRNHFPVLIGRHTIENEFLVDVSKSSVPRVKLTTSASLTADLLENPYNFHKQHFDKKEKL